jgi:hypothetical protein
MPARSRCNRHDASTLHTSLGKQKERNQNKQPRAISADMQRRRCRKPCRFRGSSLKKVCASEDGDETPQEETARKQTPEQTTARPRMNSPLFIHPCCAVDQKNSMPEEPAKPMLRKCARFKRCHQSIDTRVIASVWFTQIVPCSETPRGAAEGLGTHAANTPTRLAHAGLALGAASTGR